MVVSIIIPTYNGAHKILSAIRSLEKQDYKPKEIIVVVDGSTDNTVELLRNAEINLPGFRIIEQANGGRAQVRNRGAVAATGDLLVFLDDDMIVPGQWLSAHVEHHALVGNSLLCGKLEAVTTGQEGEFIVFEVWQNFKWNKGITQDSETASLLSKPYLAACNFSVPKKLFMQLGQFDERLNDAEDYDLAFRAALEQVPIYFSPKAFAYHYDAGLKNFKSYIRRLRQYRVAQEHLVSQKPELYGDKHTYINFPGVPKGIKSIVFDFFAKEFWISVMDRGYLRWLPKALRCKMYDIIVTANGVFFTSKVPL